MRSEFAFLIFGYMLNLLEAVELTFELADNAKECYYRDIEKGQNFKFEYQVITGGQYDIDLFLYSPLSNNQIQYNPVLDPNKEYLFHREVQKQFDSKDFVANHTGTHIACFSNEFSSFSHKLIYYNWYMEDEEPFGSKALDGIDHAQHPLTMMESATEIIHDNLNEVSEHQTHYRLNEASGRIFAEELNNRVMVLSLSETLAILIVGIGQIMVLRNFFTDKRTMGR